MNPLMLLLGVAAAKGMTDYPAEIKNLKNQMPKSEQEAFLQDYKKLSGSAKGEFKDALRRADMATASKVLGHDVAKYSAVKTADAAPPAPTTSNGSDVPDLTPVESDFMARINKILAVPTSIDPELVAEAAKRYEEAVPRNSSGDIAAKTSKLINLST